MDGYLLVFTDPIDKYYVNAFNKKKSWAEGTYELIGPKVLGNKEKFDQHLLISHNTEELPDFKRTYRNIRNILEVFPYEGIVFHHEDGRMAKIKKKDFGFNR